MRRPEEAWDTFLPKTVVGIAVWILMLALGASLSGLIFFAIYQRRINDLDQRFIKIEQNLGTVSKKTEEIEARLKRLQEDRVGIQGGSSKSLDEPTAVARSVALSIVHIDGIDKDNIPTVGSGFVVKTIVGTDEAWVLTAYHLVAGAVEGELPVSVVAGSASYQTTVRESDPGRDLALVVVNLEGLVAISRSKDDPQPDARVWAVGAGSGGDRATALEAKLTQVTALGIQTDQPTIASLSGGPLLDAQGKVIGVLSAAYAPPGISDAGGWAIPIRLMCQKVLRCPQKVEPRPSP